VAVCSFRMLVNFCWYHISEDIPLHSHCHANLRYNIPTYSIHLNRSWVCCYRCGYLAFLHQTYIIQVNSVEGRSFCHN
jgi:hypothetical protein